VAIRALAYRLIIGWSQVRVLPGPLRNPCNSSKKRVSRLDDVPLDFPTDFPRGRRGGVGTWDWEWTSPGRIWRPNPLAGWMPWGSISSYAGTIDDSTARGGSDR
jgi:hypothetical protein